MNRSESDPPSGEEEEEILSSSTDSESGTERNFKSPEEKAHWDWLVGLSDKDREEYTKARKACTKSWKSFPLVLLHRRAREALVVEAKTWEVWKELRLIKESLLEGCRDLNEKLNHLIALVPFDFLDLECDPYQNRLKRAKRLLIKINLKLGETTHSEEVGDFSDSESVYEESDIDTEEKTPTQPQNLHTMDAITNCESKLPQAQKDLLDKKKLERRSIRGGITKAINKLVKDVDSGKKNAIAISKNSLSKTLEELDKKDQLSSEKRP